MMLCEGLSQKYAALETPRRVVMCTFGQRVHVGPAGAVVTLALLEIQELSHGTDCNSLAHAHGCRKRRLRAS